MRERRVVKDKFIHPLWNCKKLENMQNRLDGKLVLLYTLLVLQIFIVMIYVASTPPAEINVSSTKNPVSFIAMETPQGISGEKARSPPPTYRTITSDVKFRDVKTSEFFYMHNQTACWTEGVDMAKMQDIAGGRCICKQGWHGSDCGQPEVVWRAIMASKQNIKLKHRKSARRIIYHFTVNDDNFAIAEIIVEELFRVVDLFVICDLSISEDNFKHKLSKGLLSAQQSKILYVNIAAKARKPKRLISRYIWDKISRSVRNIKEDDIYVRTEAEEILNWRALMFLKVYDGWPQPIGFRLRWSVFGFFWLHPLKTTITVGACTVGLIYEGFRTNSMVLQGELAEETGDRDVLGLVIGDLNHYGGWYCHYCQSPGNILISLRRDNKTKSSKIFDVASIEELIGSGVWIDNKTSLLRAYKSRDVYFAPETALGNMVKHDWLVDNFYAKLDYY